MANRGGARIAARQVVWFGTWIHMQGEQKYQRLDCQDVHVPHWHLDANGNEFIDVHNDPPPPRAHLVVALEAEPEQDLAGVVKDALLLVLNREPLLQAAQLAFLAGVE